MTRDPAFTDIDFAVAAPARTNVAYFRGDRQNPNRMLTRGATADVLAFANEVAVIDHESLVAFVGRFKDALQRAQQMVAAARQP